MSRLAAILAVTAAFMCADEPATARDATQGPRVGSSVGSPVGLSVAVVSNGVVTYKIPNGPGGLELSSNAGMITVTSGSNSVTVRGPALTLSGSVALAPFSTPGVRITPKDDGGYTAALDTLLSELPDIDTPEKKEAGSRLANELADADFGDRAMASRSCVAPLSNNSASP